MSSTTTSVERCKRCRLPLLPISVFEGSTSVLVKFSEHLRVPLCCVCLAHTAVDVGEGTW
ncbi:hypothetical protein OH77DRAFT_305584 [Trametes cingulata]|nr:hypothetical protein OH77DRAFT_305584 [Trametes cingulata]